MESQNLTLSKMRTDLKDGYAHYFLGEMHVNSLLGQRISIHFNGQIQCVACGRGTKKSFQQGYCFPCMRSLAECDSCMVRPETCHYHAGTCREPKWGETHCFQDHFIYLANTGALKVGITRQTNVPHRWMDQGAEQALPILKVKERLHAGLIEVMFKSHVADKTNWRTMLKGDFERLNLAEKRDALLAEVYSKVSAFTEKYGADSVEVLSDQEEIHITYPTLKNPVKISTHNLDKDPLVEGELMGVRGQYLILDTGVLNIRKFSSYNCKISLT